MPMSKLKNKIVLIKGMHCRSCEILIEEELLKIDGVQKAKVSEKNGTAEIFYTGEVHDTHIEEAVCGCGYSVGSETEVTDMHRKEWVSKNPDDYRELFMSGTVLVVVYFLANWLGFFNTSFNTSNNLGSLSVVLLIGLTAGFSTCMALVGGLVLGVSSKFAEKHPRTTSLEKFKPHIWFNLGRISIFMVLGGVIGYFGSFLQLGPSSIGFLTILVGLVMLSLGLQTIGIFPRLEKFKFTLPKGLYKLVGIDAQKQSEYSHRSSFILGGLTFFLPCGFTQAMQLFAISSGSVTTGALTMGVFALGTAPGLLGIGGLTSLVKGAFAKPFFRFVGLAVIALSIFNISNGLNLSGLTLPRANGASTKTTTVSDPNVTLVNGVQVVRMTQSGSGYSPRSFTIQKGLPVKWVITSTNPNSCAASILSSQLNIRKFLEPGENIIEFTPSQTGIIKFSCSMGMYTGSFNVVDGPVSDTGETTQNALAVAAAPSIGCSAGAGGCGASGGGCGGCGGGAKKVVQPSTPAVQPETIPSEDTSGTQVQLIKTVYTVDKDIVPNSFQVKTNVPVRFEIDAKEDGFGCMGSVALPKLSKDYYQLEKDQKIVFNFTPTTIGTYQITCAMGVPRGTIKVI